MNDARHDRQAVIVIAAVIIVNAMLYLMSRGQTYVHIDAIAHVNKARGIFDSFTPGLKQLGTIWLPLQHILMAPLAWFDVFWVNGAAGSILSAACFIATSWFLYSTAYSWTSSRAVGWLAFLFFALNPRLTYLFTTPMTEPLMIACAAGLLCYLARWARTDSWNHFALAAGFAFAGTLARYEGWALAAAAVPVVAVIARKQRAASTVLFAGAVAAGPMLWMLYNMAYFEDPLIFTWGRGSARDYALDYSLRTGHGYATAGNWTESIKTYFVDAAYCVHPVILWMAAAAILVIWIPPARREWRISLIVLVCALVPFAYYVLNLYFNMVPILMPGLLKDEPHSIFNVRYGSVMAASLPVLAAFLSGLLFRQVQRQRAYALLFLTPLFLPDPIPTASVERVNAQLTENLFYVEGVHNQSFWMPPFVEVAWKLKSEMEQYSDANSFVLTNTRVVHPAVWATAIPMRRFIHEMNKERWDENLIEIDSGIRWVITEEGDQLWHAQGDFLKREFVEVAQARTPSTGTVHLYRRKP